MIHLFNGKKRILFFPVGFANSVARWILGVHSPSGTISIKNTATPGDNGSLALDVNVDALRRIMAGVIDEHDLTEREIKRTKDIVHGAIDGTSLIMGGEHISVSMDWLQQNIQKFMGGGVDMSAYALDADLAALEEDVADIADLVDAIDADVDDLFADLYDASGNKAWVDLTTNQTINGSKSFTNTVFIRTEGTQYYEIENTKNSTRGYFGLGEIWLDKNAGAIPIHFRDFGRVEKARIYYDYTDTLLHLVTCNNNGSGYKSNGVVLSANPTDVSDTSSKVVPTMGWVNDKFIRNPTDKTLYTGTKNRITEISWTGTVLRYKVTRETYYKGLLESSTTDMGWSTIDTPVIYTPQ